MGVHVREKEKGSGVWWVFIHHNGKRRSKQIGDKKLAKDVAKKIEAKLTLGEMGLAEEDAPSKPTFREYATIWLEDYIKPLRKETTYERYNDILTRYVFPVFGSTPIDEVKRGQVRQLLMREHKKGRSKSMICLIRDVMSGPMGYAVDEEMIQANPVTGILKRMKMERDKKLEVEPLTSEEVRLFLETCETLYPEYHTLFLCAFRTGMRMGELLALEWRDIDWNSKFIHVQRAYRRGVVDKTKTGRSRRVDMSDQLYHEMKNLLTERKKEGLQKGKGGPVKIIFHRDGGYMEQNYIRRVFKRILTKAGIREIRFHDMRHTFASLLLTDGVTPVYVKEQLGHSSIEMTVDIYGHLIPSSNRNAVNRLDGPHQTAPYTHPEKTKGL
ncbi:MAG: hypothetical protein CSA22_02035 [Deltaproteobacteria bacterium]|nr:MAG: hypothetical protein CSA22_02035 [Deltaproteobacteria bacterium]